MSVAAPALRARQRSRPSRPARLRDPHRDRQRVRRNARMELDDRRRRTGPRPRALRPRLHLLPPGRRPGDRVQAEPMSSRGADALMPEHCWAQMQAQARQLGHAGIAAMAISAVDVALWDLKAKLLDVCLADALPRFHDEHSDLRHRAASATTVRPAARSGRRVGERRPAQHEDQGRAATSRRSRSRRVRAGDRRARGRADGRRQRRLHAAEALLWAETLPRPGRHLLRGAGQLAGSCRAAPRCGGALQPGWRSRRASTAGTFPTTSGCSRPAPVDILQADVTRCGGITNLLRIDGAVQGAQPALLRALRAGDLRARLLRDGERDPPRVLLRPPSGSSGCCSTGRSSPAVALLTPDRSRPGLGLELQQPQAERYRGDREEASDEQPRPSPRGSTSASEAAWRRRDRSTSAGCDAASGADPWRARSASTPPARRCTPPTPPTTARSRSAW